MLMFVDQLIPNNAAEVNLIERMQPDDEAAIEVHCRRCSRVGSVLKKFGEHQLGNGEVFHGTRKVSETLCTKSRQVQ